jgi:hypothetical protein
VRGNHDAHHGQADYAGGTVIDLPGARIVLLDTVWPRHENGRVGREEIDRLDEAASSADRPVIAMGHHHPWDPSSTTRSETYFGIVPDDSEALIEVIARRPAIVGYLAGHTHRNRVRRFAATGELPYVEVGCVKDFPGSWAEYRVYEGGVLQIHHRISTPEALTWSERCRVLYRDFGLDYVAYAMGRLSDRCLPLAPPDAR